MQNSGLWDQARLAMSSGRLVEAERMYMDGLIKIVTNYEAPLAILPAYRGLSELYTNSGKIHLSLRLHREMIRIYEQEFGPRHVTVALASLELGILCRKSGDFYLANKFYRNGIQLLWQRLDSLANRLPHECWDATRAACPQSGGCPCWETDRCKVKEMVESVQERLNEAVGIGDLAKCIVDDSVEGCIRELARRFERLIETAGQEKLPCGFDAHELQEIGQGLTRLGAALPVTPLPATAFVKKGADR